MAKQEKAADPDHPRWLPPYRAYDISAIQAVAIGEATADQQRHAMRFILEELCMTYRDNFHEDSTLSHFGQGRRFVGLQIVKYSTLNVTLFLKAEANKGE